MNGVIAPGDRTSMILGDGRTVALAEPRRRVVARLLDTALLTPVVLLFAGSFVAEGLIEFAGAIASIGGSSYGASYAVPRWLYACRWAGFLALMLYEPVMVARWGATVGKLAAGIRVVRFADGGRVSAGRSWLRVLLPSAAGVLTLGVGWFAVWLAAACSMTSGRRWRGWHDSLAGTVTVTKKSAPHCGRSSHRTRAVHTMDERWQRFMSQDTRPGSAFSSDSATPASGAGELVSASRDGNGR